MSNPMLNEYESILQSLADEMKKYGSSRVQLENASAAMLLLEKMNRELNDSATSLTSQVADNSDLLRVVASKSDESVVRTRVAIETLETTVAMIRTQTDSVATKLIELNQYIDEYQQINVENLEELGNKVNETSISIETLTTMTRDGFVETRLYGDSLAGRITKIEKSQNTQETVGYLCLTLLVIVAVIQSVGMFI